MDVTSFTLLCVKVEHVGGEAIGQIGEHMGGFYASVTFGEYVECKVVWQSVHVPEDDLWHPKDVLQDKIMWL